VRRSRLNALQLRERARSCGGCAPEVALRSRWAKALGGSSPLARIDRKGLVIRAFSYSGDEWETQNLLDPPRAKRTLQLAETRLIESEPELSALRARQDEIVAEMRGLLERARGSGRSASSQTSGRSVLIAPGERQARVADAVDIRKAGVQCVPRQTLGDRPMGGRGRLPPVLVLSVQGMEAAAFSPVRAELVSLHRGS